MRKKLINPLEHLWRHALLLAMLLETSGAWAQPNEATSFDLWVAGVKVTSENAADVTGALPTAAPQVYYNPETNVLTLDNAELTKESGDAIETKMSSLTVHLKGSSYITCYDETAVAFKSTAEGGTTITFTTDEEDPGFLSMATRYDAFGDQITTEYENRLYFNNSGDYKYIEYIEYLNKPYIYAYANEDEAGNLVYTLQCIKGDDTPDGTNCCYAIDYAEESLTDVPETETTFDDEEPFEIPLLGPCTVTAYAKYGDVRSETGVAKLFGLTFTKARTTVGENIELPTVIPALDQGMAATFTTYNEAYVSETEGVFTATALGTAYFDGNIDFGEAYPESYEILNSDGMLGNVAITILPPTPTISLVSGSYDGPQTVTLSSDYVQQNEQTASIRYFFGEDKNVNALTYEGQLTIGESTVLNAWVEGHDETGLPICSDTVSAAYTIRQDPDLRFYDATIMTHFAEVQRAEAVIGGENFVQPALQNRNELPVAYSSSNEQVATIDADGLVTLVGTGTSTITASSEATDEFLAGSAAYTLDVSRKLDISFGNRSWATYCAPEDLSVPNGITAAYQVKGIVDGTVTAEPLRCLPKGVGVLLERAEGGPTEDFVATAYETSTEAFDFSRNLLHGTGEATSVASLTDDDATIYVLYYDEFVKTTSGTIPACRAYLALPATVAPVGARLRIVRGGDAATAIDGVDATATDAAHVFDMKGRRLAGQPTRKGIYLKGGKKVVVTK